MLTECVELSSEKIFFRYSEGENTVCFLKIRLKKSGFSYPVIFEISVTL